MQKLIKFGRKCSVAVRVSAAARFFDKMRRLTAAVDLLYHCNTDCNKEVYAFSWTTATVATIPAGLRHISKTGV